MNKKGVTLVELAVVLVIIAIAAALTTPAIGRWLPIYRLRSATRDVVSTMRMAQAKAVTGNIEYRVQFDVANRGYILQYQTTAGLVNDGDTPGTPCPHQRPDGKPAHLQELPNGIQIKEINFGGGVSYAVFNSNSTSSSGNVVLRNSRGAERKIVLLSNTGRVRIEGN